MTYINAPRFKFYYENNHNLYLESGYFFGKYTGPRFSINYDGIVRNYQYLIFSLRVGAGYSFAKDYKNSSSQGVIFPISVHIQFTNVNTQAGGFRRYNIKNIFQRLYLQTNLDFAIGGYNYAKKQQITPFFSIGFRHQNPNGGWMYRLACDIQFEDVFKKEVFKRAFFGPIISIGYTF